MITYTVNVIIFNIESLIKMMMMMNVMTTDSCSFKFVRLFIPEHLFYMIDFIKFAFGTL